MTRFLKLKQHQGNPQLVNIEHIIRIQPSGVAYGARVHLIGDIQICVEESLDRIIEMIEQEEVVK